MRSALLPAVCGVYLCVNVGPQGLLVVGLPAPFIPHSASLGPATATRVLSTPVPVSAPSTGLDERLFCISLVLDPLAVRFCQFLLCKEAQCVYLRRHLGSPTKLFYFKAKQNKIMVIRGKNSGYKRSK